MYPVIFQTLPEIFSFLVVILLVEVCTLLLVTGRRFLKQASYVAVGVAGATFGEGMALWLFPGAAWFAIGGGLVASLALCHYIRPVAVGVALAYLAFYCSTYLVNIEYAQYMAALVLFAYGLLLTDLAPTFVSSLLASGILLLTGIWVGVPVPLLFAAVSLVAAVRILATVLPHKTMERSGRNRPASMRIGG